MPFIWKLSQLKNCEFNATLNFKTYGGRIYASMNADLDHLHCVEAYPGHNQDKKMPNPARERRRLRRQHAAQVSERSNNSIRVVQPEFC